MVDGEPFAASIPLLAMATRTRVHRPNQPADPPEDLALHLLARELIVARIRAGLRQHQVAHRMGTTQSAISRLEGATGHRPSFVTLERYAEAVGCDLVVTLRRRPFPWEADPSDLA